EGEPRRDRARRRLRIGDHEEVEEKQAARFELVEEHWRALAEIEDAGGAKEHPRAEKSEADVAAEGAVRHHAAEREDPEKQERSFSPLRRRAPGVRGEQHARAQAEVRRIEEVPPADTQDELASDGEEGGERRNPEQVCTEKQRQAEGGDDG